MGRQTKVVNPQGAYSSTACDANTGRVTSRTNLTGEYTGYEYCEVSHTNAGRLKCIIAANGEKTCYSYTLRGELQCGWGDVPYHEERVYNEYGDLVELHTYRGGSGWSGTTWPASPSDPDITKWYYHEGSGLLANKTDAAGRSVTYTYTADGQLQTLTWARGTNARCSVC